MQPNFKYRSVRYVLKKVQMGKYHNLNYLNYLNFIMHRLLRDVVDLNSFSFGII